MDEHEALEPMTRQALQRRFPDLSSATPLTFRRFRTDGSHAFVLAEARGAPVRRALVKGVGGGGRRLSTDRFTTESWLLGEIGPQIAAANPRARCPELFGLDAERRVLVIEMIEGVTLKSQLFGLRRATAPPGELLGLCGEWLARFHTLTRLGEEGNPFDWVVSELESDWTRWVLEQYGDAGVYARIHALARQWRDAHPDWRRPRCWVHGLFAPHHVLVRDDDIYVVDLESSHPGYPYEDLAFFVTCHELFVPWRQVIGRWRMPAAARYHAFREGYLRQAPPLDALDRTVLHFATLRALARFLGSAASGNFLVGPGARGHGLKANVLARWWAHRVRAVTARELRALSRGAP